MAKRQGAKHAVLPVHTQKEKEEYDLLLRANFSDVIKNSKLPDFEEFAKKWSTIVDGQNIFYKAPEHLRSYYSKWMEYQNINKTKKNYKEQLDLLQQNLRSSSRKRSIPKAQAPLPLKIPRVDQNTAVTSRQSTVININYNQESSLALQPSSSTPIFNDLLQYQHFLYTMAPSSTRPSSSQSSSSAGSIRFDDLPKKRLRTCKQCSSNTCPGRTGRGICQQL